jgi:hypothetical protein
MESRGSGPAQAASIRFFCRQEGVKLGPAADEKGDERPVGEDHVGTRDAGGAKGLGLRPGKGSTERVGGISGGEDHRLGVVAGGRAQPEALDGPRERELSPPETGHEVAPSDPPRLLQGGKHRIDRGESSADFFAHDRVGREDPVASEELLREGGGSGGGLRVVWCCEEREAPDTARGCLTQRSESGPMRMAPRAT